MIKRNIAPQPDLRSFIVYDRLPAGCIAFPVKNEDSVPHLRPGDIAVVDTGQREPIERELFLIQYKSRRQPTHEIVELWTKVSHCLVKGAFVGWWIGPYARPRSLAQGAALARRGLPIGTVDGPLVGEEGIAYLSEMLVGRIVGVLQPDFQQPRRSMPAC